MVPVCPIWFQMMSWWKRPSTFELKTSPLPKCSCTVFLRGTHLPLEIFNNHGSSVSHMVPGLHFENVEFEPWTIIQVMARSLFGAKPLQELMLSHWKLDLQEQTLMKYESNAIIFFQENTFRNYDTAKCVNYSYTYVYIFSCDQAAIWLVQSVRLSVRHTFFTMFPSSYHHEIFRSYYQWQKWRPCQRSRSKVKVTEVTTQLNRFRTVTPVWIHIWWWNDAYSLIMLRRGALLFLKVIRQISRSNGSKKRWIWPRLGVSGL